MRTREVVTSVTFFQPEEITAQAAATIAGQDVGEAVLYVAGQFTLKVKLPLPIDRLARTPKALARLEAEYEQQLHQLPFFSTPEQIEQQRHLFLEALLEQLDNAVQNKDALPGRGSQLQIDHQPQNDLFVPEQEIVTPNEFPTDF